MNFIQEWTGISKTARILGITRTNIYKCCRGTEKSAGGFIWRYKDSNFEVIPQPKFEVKVLDIKTNSVVIYPSLIETSKAIDYCVSTICAHIENNLLLGEKYKVEKIYL